MKQRILSFALGLCLCLSSTSVAYAYQETSALQKGVLTEGATDGADIGDDEAAAPQETPALQEGVLTEDNTDGPDISDDEAAAPQETPALQEGVLTEDNTDESDIGSDEIIVPQEVPVLKDNAPQEEVLMEEPTDELVTRDSTVPTPTEAYNAMIAFKNRGGYTEGTPWTDNTPYSDSNYYRWNGGPLNGTNIVAVGCVAFAFELSDAAFGSLPARMYAAGAFSFADIKVGDILRVNNNAHTVIVLEVSDVGVVVAEGNYSGKVHWGRTMSKDEVMNNTNHYITRYPEGYISPDDPTANDIIGEGPLDGGLAWKLTKAGTLTISGQGAMPDFGSTDEQPWNDKSGQIRKVVIENGVTSIGACAFWDCGVLGVEIASSVTTIGNSAFRGSSIISATIPSSVRTVGDSAFRGCQNLSSVTVCEGVETIDQNAFRSCTSLTSIALPASIEEVGAGAFFQCQAMTRATFAPGSKQVKLGDNLFTECYYLMNVTLPQNIDCIGAGMFLDCIMLGGVEIPQGVESIGEQAFASCSGMTTVIIPSSVTTIGSSAFSNCPGLADIYFTGTEAQWNSISKMGDTAAVSNATIHYNYTPATSPDPNPGDNDNNTGDNDNNPGDNDNNAGDNDNNSGGNKPGDNSGNTSSGNRPGSSSGDNNSNNMGSDNDEAESIPMATSVINSGIKTVVETWKPTTLDELKRYSCMGKEAVQYTQSKDNAYQIGIENAMQGPMCFESFEAVLGDYTIGRTYNIYAYSNTIYSTDEEIQFTIEIPAAVYKNGREYKMICVTKDGKPIIYNDLDSNPGTITIKTNRFYAYALIYK